MKIEPVAGVIARRLGDVVVLIQLASNGIYELNETGARVWELIQHGPTQETLVERVLEEFEFDEGSGAVAADIQQLLTGLQAAGLITIS
jgi:hypothetical protein